ncbi:uncharacterized protein [Diadema antillarum]|uniref:uncharacterized protein n=1 Tax=Diadema antillarum TaxID=105358 RepID=UPI003A83CD5D
MMYFLHFLCAVMFLHQVRGQATCDSVLGSKCSCRYSNPKTGTIKTFNFNALGSKTGEPAFPYQRPTDPDGFEYAYNPCVPFTDQDSTECQDVAACQRSDDGKLHYSLGDPTPKGYTVGTNNDIVITYATDVRTSLVTFHCDATAKTKAVYVVNGETSSDNTYLFTINTCLACLDDVKGCHGSSSGGGGGLTVGGILCIIFTVLVVVYIIGGVLFMKFVRGAQGRELVPNYSFWIDLPGLIKDGCMFLVGLCKGGCRGQNYESFD